MDAQNYPTRRRRIAETADTSIEQAPDIKMPGLGEDIEREPDIIPATAEVLNKQYADQIAFMEEPITIMIQPGSDRDPQIVHDVWVNGKGAEVFVNGKWIEFGCIPVGIEVVTKRKYVEVLARKKTDKISTQVIKHQDGEENKVVRATSHGCPFSVVEDRNPRGRQWLSDVMRERA